MRCLVILTCILPCLLSPALGQQDQLAKRLLGAWRLISVEGTSLLQPRVYDRPTGMIVYEPSGRMAVQIASIGERKRFAKGVATGTMEEKAAAFDSYIAYYGNYTIDAKAGTITHHLQDSLSPDMRGRDLVRYFELQGENRIVLLPAEDGKGGLLPRKDVKRKLVWERLK